jgi:hypothetical protein
VDQREHGSASFLTHPAGKIPGKPVAKGLQAAELHQAFDAGLTILFGDACEDPQRLKVSSTVRLAVETEALRDVPVSVEMDSACRRRSNGSDSAFRNRT